MTQEEIDKLIAKESAKATTIAALPIPLIDIAGVIYIQYNLVEKLAQSYGISLDSKKRILLAAILVTGTGKAITELLHILADKTSIDTLISSTVIDATITGLATGIIGDMYNIHFQKGGGVEDFGIDAVVKYLQVQIATEKLSIKSFTNNLIGSQLIS